MGRPSPYTPEFRADAVALVVNSNPPRSIADVAVELGLNRETLRSWVRRTETEAASAAVGGLTAAEREELKVLLPQGEGFGGGEGDPAEGHPVFARETNR